MSVITAEECRELGLVVRHDGHPDAYTIYTYPGNTRDADWIGDIPEVVIYHTGEITELIVTDRAFGEKYQTVKHRPSKADVLKMIEIVESKPS